MSQILSREKLVEIAGEFGTPVYVYHAERIGGQYGKLKSAFGNSDVRFFYACKALTNINILQYIKSLGLNIDCSSINEVKLAIMAGFESANILYTSNGIAFDEIEEAQKLNVHINIDSLSNLEKFGKKFGYMYPLGLRLRPNIMGGGNIKISTGHNKSKFGIPVDQIEELIKLIEKYDLLIQGLHIHTGSDITDINVFLKGIAVLSEIIPKFKNLEFIDLGGGFKVPYKPGDTETDMVLLAQKVSGAFENHASSKGRHLQVWFEPGKFFVSEAGYFITRVNVIKENKDITFVGINSGFNHLIRPMFYEAYHYIENISNPGGPLKSYAVTGNICETDSFAWNRELNEVHEGDYLVFYNAGAYGFEMSSNYNARFKPAEVLVKDGKSKLIRRRDVFEDLLRNQVF